MGNLSAIRSLQRQIKPLAGRKGNKGRKSVERSAGLDGYAFLRQEFKPFYGVQSANLKKTEREFFYSLSNLCALYNWEVPLTVGLDFPQNVSHAYACIKELAVKVNVRVLIVVDDAGVTTLATVRDFGIGDTLYYIPVRPYWYICKNKKLRRLCEVLTCIFSYLYRVIGVSYFRKRCFVRSVYDTIEEMLYNQDEEEAEGELDEERQEVEDLVNYGDDLFALLDVPYDASFLQELLKSRAGLSREVFLLARDFLKLSLDYPGRSMDSCLRYDLFDKGSYRFIRPEHYLSFFWSSKDCLQDMFMDWVNNDLMEMEGRREPVVVQCFDRPQESECFDFDFETRLFSYLDRLAFILNSFDNG
jgi:hypothetical protein